MGDKKIESDLIRGHIDTIILKVLIEQDRYGYEIIKRISECSEGAYELKEATMYSCVKRLEKEKYIEAYWGDESLGGRRKYYRVLDAGKDVYKRNLKDWEFAKLLLDKLM